MASPIAIKIAIAPTAMPALAPVDRPVELEASEMGEVLEDCEALEVREVDEPPELVPNIGADAEGIGVDEMNASYNEQ